jgi:biotin carboxylase
MDQRPLLAVVFSPRSRPWSEIVEAAADTCRLLWVVDSDVPGISTTAKVLRRFGTVIDVANRTAEELVRVIDAEHPDGITSFIDADLHRQAWLAAALELPSPSVRTVVFLTDKLLQRQLFEAAGIPVPKFAEVREPADHDEVTRLCEILSFPMLLKPRDGSACCNIHPVSNAEELRRLFAEVGQPSQMILEEEMEDLPSASGFYADSFSIDTIVSRGTFSHMGVRGMFEKALPFRPTGGYFPAELTPAAVSELHALATASIRALGSEFGYFRTEIKFTPQGCQVIEVNGRPSGVTPVIVELASGIPVLQLCMRHALGEHVMLADPIPCDRVGYRYICEPPTSALRVLKISGLQALGELPGVMQIDVHKAVGDPVDWRNGSLDKVFQVTGAVAGYAELAEHYLACSAGGFVTYEHRN